MKKIIKQILLVTCMIGAPTCSHAFPFQANPQSFQNYVNALKWQDGSKRTFQKLEICSFDTDVGAVVNNSFLDVASCNAGFVVISDPMGTKVCRITTITYMQASGGPSGKTNYGNGDCRYK